MTNSELIQVSFWADMMYRLGMMLVLSVVILSLISRLERRDGCKRPRGVRIFCFLLVLASVYKLWGFISYPYYRFMFQQLSDQMIIVRYCFSITLRLGTLFIAMGVLFLKDKFRKALVLLSIFTLVTLYWKHPFFVFENIARQTEQMFLNKGMVEELSYPIYPRISFMFNYALDIIFSGAMLFYFTRPKVKELFK